MPTATQMPPAGPKNQDGGSATPTSRRSRLLGTRRGAIAIAVLAGIAALTIVLAFMSNFRDSVRSDSASVRVLVAGRQLDSGTSGDVIAQAGLYRAIEVKGDEATGGAIHDPAALRGKHTTTTVYEGQQLSDSDFASGSDPIAGKLSGTERALSVPVDAAHGNIGQVHAGSRVEVFGGFAVGQVGGRTSPTTTVLAKNALVLAAPSTPSSGIGAGKEQQVVLRLSDVEAARVAAFAGPANGSAVTSGGSGIWLAVRPPTLAKDSGSLR